MTFTIIQPADVDTAIDCLRRVPPLVDCPTQRRQRDPDSLSRAFAGGDFRRPDLVWVAVGDEGGPRAAVAGLLTGAQTVLDFFGADDEAALTAVVAAATAGVRDQEWPEACLYVPPGAGVDSPELRAWARALRDAGWDLLVERHHYDLVPHPGLAAPPADCPLHLEPLVGPEDPRLEPTVRDVLVGSLDVADRTLTARVGLERAARETVRDLLASDPWQCLHLAYDAGSEPVGLVSWIGAPGGPGYVLQVGVVRGCRGRRYGQRLLELATCALVEAGCRSLVADVDITNTPMAAAFARVGWTVAEQRIDMLPRELLLTARS